MKDPYEILEVRKGSSTDEVKSAYKKLVKKYHPDQYANNPLADLAEEKMKEINEAYDSLTKGYESTYRNQSTNNSTRNHQQDRRQEYNQGEEQSNQQNSRSQHSKASSGFNIYNEIRRNIEMDNLRIAEQMLENISDRNAEWNYLKGIIAQRKGWYDQALRYLTVAINLDPYNIEYKTAYSSFSSRNNSYKSRGNSSGYSDGEECCILCSKILMSDECFGFSNKRKC